MCVENGTCTRGVKDGEAFKETTHGAVSMGVENGTCSDDTIDGALDVGAT